MSCVNGRLLSHPHPQQLLFHGAHLLQGPVNIEIYEGLLMLQHRGQDSAGMVTLNQGKFIEYKANGLVKDVFNNDKTMNKLQGAGSSCQPSTLIFIEPLHRHTSFMYTSQTPVKLQIMMTSAHVYMS